MGGRVCICNTLEAEPDSDNLSQVEAAAEPIVCPLGGPQIPPYAPREELLDLLMRASGLACDDVAQ